ncbi:hypothetical protein [Catellatospora methionotrophica]|uniref:hypothetical protein n=1 Tax=Catellatospora methionotrophica TaxID=121620 RepID=UPI0034098B6D
MFSPALEVLYAQPAVLAPPDVSFDGFLRRFPGLAEAEAVCLTGSIAAGWGNTFSDIDLYAFADTDIDLPVDETMEMWPGKDPALGLSWNRWIGAYGDNRVDLKVWPTATLAVVLDRYLATEVEFAATSANFQDFIYRLSVGVPLKNPDFFARMKELLDRSSYRRALARASKTEAENALTDVAGQLHSGDARTARVSATLAAWKMADSSLAFHGEVCRGQKWLLRRLERTPECGITADEYQSVVLDGARPGESNADCARRIARWTQAHLVRLEDQILSNPR